MSSNYPNIGAAVVDTGIILVKAPKLPTLQQPLPRQFWLENEGTDSGASGPNDKRDAVKSYTENDEAPVNQRLTGPFPSYRQSSELPLRPHLIEPAETELPKNSFIYSGSRSRTSSNTDPSRHLGRRSPDILSESLSRQSQRSRGHHSEPTSPATRIDLSNASSAVELGAHTVPDMIGDLFRSPLEDEKPAEEPDALEIGQTTTNETAPSSAGSPYQRSVNNSTNNSMNGSTGEASV
jgi:hypothetical protein